MSESKDLRYIKRTDGVVMLTFDQAGESVNTLRDDFAPQLHQVLDEINAMEGVQALVLCSAKSDNFVAGADIGMLDRVSSSQEARELSAIGQKAVDRIADFRVPVVAAIHGACLGGGLEIALSCSGRVASLHPATRLGLPEVQLGILPGMGGTLRLPQVTGLAAALDLLLSGRQISAEKARKIGLVDEVTPHGILTEVAVARALQLAESKERKGDPLSRLRQLLSPDELRELALADNPLGRKLVFDQAERKLLEKTKGNYPATEEILRVVRKGLVCSHKEALLVEAEAFGKLVVSPESRALRHLYFSGQSLKKERFVESEVETPRLRRLGVVGAGLMGSGVAYVSALHAGCQVRLKDLREEGIQEGLRRIDRLLEKRVARRSMSEVERNALMMSITRATDPELLGEQQVVIEAVFEELSLKRAILAEVEASTSAEVIFATNTSSIPIADIAQGARHPERVIGMHYFSPVDKMPLLEIIATKQTAPWVVQACVDLGRRQKKTVIVVGDGPGFYTTRILGPYLNEAAFALMEGASIEEIDRELVQGGFPVGPLTLLDEIGIDVGGHVAGTLSRAFGVRQTPPPSLATLLTKGRLGRKNQRGFYDYRDRNATSRSADPSVYAELGLRQPVKKPSIERGFLKEGSTFERCLLSMVNEAIHCLGDGILQSPRDGDMGAIYGLGFPPFLGGPFFLVDRLGAREVLGRIERLQSEHGARFEPAPRLRELAEKDERFYRHAR